MSVSEQGEKMLVMMTFAAAALLGAPVPIGPDMTMAIADYPPEAIQTHEEGSTIFVVTVSPTGGAIGCEIAATSGSNLLDYRTCKLARQRLQFTPAHDRTGAAMVGTYRNQQTWHLDSTSMPMHDPDQVAVTVSRLPSGLAPHASVDVDILVSETGQLLDCSADPKPDYGKLGDLACQQVRATWHPKPAHDQNRKPVPSIQTVRVGFSVGAKS